MHDSFALARLILAPIVRPLVFATSAFIGVSATYVLYILISSPYFGLSITIAERPRAWGCKLVQG
jgi:hypothetical protein